MFYHSIYILPFNIYSTTQTPSSIHSNAPATQFPHPTTIAPYAQAMDVLVDYYCISRLLLRLLLTLHAPYTQAMDVLVDYYCISRLLLY